MRIFLLLVLMSCFSLAQNKKLDSLKQNLKKNESFELLNSLAWEYSAVDTDSLFYFNKLSVKYLKTEKQKGQFLALDALGLLLNEKLKKSEQSAKQSCAIATKVNDFETASSSYNILSKIKNFQGNFHQSEMFAHKALQFSLKNKNPKKILKPLINYGSTLIQNGKMEEGIKIYQSAEKYFYKGSEFEQGYIYANLGRIFLDKGDYPIASSYLKKSEERFRSIKYTAYDCEINIAYSEIYASLKNKEKALFHLDKARKNAKNDLDFSDVNYVTAELYYNLEDYGTALNYLKKAIVTNEAQEDFSRLGEDYILLSEIYTKQKNYGDADLYLKKAISLFKENKENENLRLSYEKIIPNYFKKNNLDLYSDYFTDYIKLNTEINAAEKIKALHDLDKKYKTKENEIKFAQQKLQLEKEKSKKEASLLGLALVGVISGGAFFYYRNSQKRKELKNENTLLSLQQNLNSMELQSLNKQLDPHEIKNLLASISPEIQEKAPDSYRKMLKLLNVTKASLGNNSLTESVGNQLQQIDDFLSLNKSSLSEPLEYEIESKIENPEVQLPRLILKNLVENSIKHGIKGKESGGKITVFIEEINNFILVKVDDTGKGRLNAISTDSGIGTTTYQKLFATLNQKNIEKASFEIIDKNQGTLVEVKIPVDYKYS